MIGPLVLLAAFVAMEGVSYATHRWVMHGVGMGWHRSHHAPSQGGLERNDLFPVCFSFVGFGVFLAAAATGTGWLYWAGVGVTAYGAMYLYVHELHIHRRLGIHTPDLAYLRWLREAHRRHHMSGGEPYGMLLPLLRRREPVPASTRLTRSRL